MDSLTTGLLEEGHTLKVLTLHTHKHPFVASAFSADYLAQTQFQAVFADALRADVYDVVLLESLFTTSYIPAIRRLSDAEIVLRAHNVEHQLWEEVSKGMGRGLKKWLLHLFQGKLKHEEIRSLQSVDAIAAITERDAAWIRQTVARHNKDSANRVIALPFGLDVEARPHSAMQERPSAVLHLGAMDWAPNLQGVQWLKDEVWPNVRRALPDARLDLAGRHMPDNWTSDSDLGIEVLGEVADAAATYDSPYVVVVPLHAGSGMRIKLAEALAAGRPIVTTSKGMEGMDLTSGQEVIVADTEDAMAEALTHLLTHGEEAKALGTRGRAWALQHLGHQARAKTLTLHLKSWVES